MADNKFEITVVDVPDSSDPSGNNEHTTEILCNGEYTGGYIISNGFNDQKKRFYFKAAGTASDQFSLDANGQVLVAWAQPPV
jgi:hypothetical protein